MTYTLSVWIVDFWPIKWYHNRDMWDLRVANPFGRLSIRSMFMYVAAMIAATFAFIFLTSTPVHAADASWNGNAIVYQSHQYGKAADAKAGDSRGFAAGTHVYSYVDPSTDPQKAYLIYFAPGDDPTKATSANYVVYDFTPPDTYKNASGQKTITLEAQSGESKGTTCSISGIGWLICPVTNFMADAMDWIFKVLASFLSVQPARDNQGNSLYFAWSIMRNFANVAFVIAFLIIIYSQVSNIGISNYGIKKMLPRLVIAAVLVNISYWICALAIDISNILGYSLQDLFMAITKSMTANGTNVNLGWKDIAIAVLSGGTLATAGIAALISVGSIGGAIYMLLPVLVGLMVAALVALVIMAARQAIIVILVILAPLAFVAYLLPNTEKYFEKWKDLFITMLVLFPIFSILFGGSQLAGLAIIQNANSIVMVILGEGVKVAPLAIMPFLLQFSGSLIGRIAGLANNPSKGIIDRTRNFASEQAAFRKSKVLARANVKPWRRPLSSAVQGMDNLRRKQQEQQKVNETLADNRWHTTKAHERIDTARREAERTKQILEQQHNAHWNVRARLDPNSREQELKLRVTADQESLSKAKLDTMHEEFKTYSHDTAPDFIRRSSSLSTLLTESNDANRDLALSAMRKKSAEHVQTKQLTDALLKNEERIDGQLLREYGGGVGGVSAQETVFASAINSYRSEYRDRVKERIELLHHFNPDSDARQTLAMGKDIEVEKEGIKYIFKADDDYAREAAIDEQLKKGSFAEIQDIIRESGAAITRVDPNTGALTVDAGKTHDYRTSISDAIKDYGLDKKAIFWGTQSINDIAQGKMNGEPSFNMAAARSLATGKVSDQAVSSMHAKALERLFSVTVDDLKRSEAYVAASQAERAGMERAFTDSQAELHHSAWRVVHTPVLSQNADKLARDVLIGQMRQPPAGP